MSKRDKLLAAWKNQPQPSATVETVEAVLRHYFSSGFSVAEGGSHQLRVSHPALYQHPHFIGGALSVPVTGGQTGCRSVKPFYLKRIVEAIEIVQEAENPSQETEPDHDNDDDSPSARD